MLEELGVPLEDLFDIESGSASTTDVDFRRAIADRYIIDAELGQGGMGAVYLARDVRHGRVVAVKVISPEAVSGIGLNQFHREISTIAQLHHPNILSLFDSGEAAGHPFYVMPWVRGGSLRTRLQRDVRLDLTTVLRLTRGMAEALQHAHNERILHCDVKPENVLLHNDHAWVMDFGIARKLHSEMGEWPLRKELDISAGTPAYVSPEQASGDSSLDARSDVYSLGCMVYEMIAGRTPFGGTSTQEIVATRFIVPPPPVRDYAPEVPIDVASVLERAMALPRDHRPESAAAFAAELEHAAANVPRVLAGASLTTSRAISRARRRFNRAPAHSLGGIVRGIWQDFRFAARSLSKRPAFAAAAILTLALGIGASTAIFGVVYGVLLKPLPFSEPERLVSLMHTIPGGSRNHGPATYFTYRNNQRVFEDVGVWEGIEATITGGGEPERVEVLSVSDATLPLLRVQPLRGRLFTKEDDSPGRPLRTILAYGFWQRRFGGVDGIIGQPITIDGTPAEIIGVLPASFRFLRSNASILLPQQLDPATASNMEFDFQVLGRLKAGVTLSQANADMARMIALLPPPHEVLQMQPNVRPLAADVIGDIGNILWILFAAVGVVLLIACGNVANLFLIRAEGRQQEFAMRSALGASQRRIGWVLLAESVLLALVAGALGIVLTQGTIALLRRMATAELPRVDEIAIDPTVLFFALAISLVSAALFGLIAVFRFAKPSVMALKEGGRASDAPGRHRTRNALVVAQVALALLLTIVSGLMIRTSMEMRRMDPGFTRPDEVLTFRIAIPPGLISDALQVARTHQLIAERLTRVPGVTSAGISSSITMDGEDNGNPLEPEGVSIPRGRLTQLYRYKSVAPGYFETMGNRIVAGRSITWNEIFELRRVLLISESLAREFWKDPANAIGKRARPTDGYAWREIVGVVGDERDDGLNHPPTKIVYWPMLNGVYDRQSFAYAVRSERAGTAAFQRELKDAVWSVNPNLPLSDVQTLNEIEARSMAQTSFTMVMLGIAASVALLIGVVGIYGVIAYVAAQRTREIGIRIALGAQIGEVRRMFLRRGLWLTAAGIALGIGAALAVTRVLSALLFGVGATDPLTYAAVSGVLAVVALGAMYLPARRASRVDPIIALRADV
ncbi:MAG TPA: ADOP family duplicated permease [Gemmatimonadaceae bacterium]|nr:ADOP family duplicated permease [Gemmatimonadaceae bacterium]